METRTHVERGWVGCTPGAPELRRSSFLPLDRHRFQDGGGVAAVRPRHTYRPILAATPPLRGSPVRFHGPPPFRHPRTDPLSLVHRAAQWGEFHSFHGTTGKRGKRRGNRSCSRLTRCPGRYRNRIRTPRHFRPREHRTTPSTLLSIALCPSISRVFFLSFFLASFVRLPRLPACLLALPRFLRFLRQPLFFLFLLFSLPPFGAPEIFQISRPRLPLPFREMILRVER